MCVCVGVRARVCVLVAGDQDVITIRTSIMTPLSLVVTNAFYSHNACWYMRALYNNGNELRR